MNKRTRNGKVEYLIKWEGYDNEKDYTWEPQANVLGCKDMIKEYEKQLKRQSDKDRRMNIAIRTDPKQNAPKTPKTAVKVKPMGRKSKKSDETEQ